MANQIMDLLQRRAKMIHDARVEILEPAAKEGRALTAEEQKKYDAMIDEAGALKETADRMRTAEQFDAEFAKTAVLETAPVDKAEDIQKRAVDKWFRGGPVALNEVELRAVNITDLTKGGYLQAPQQFVNSLLQAVDDKVFMRQLGTVYRIGGAESLGVPSLDTDVGDPSWTTELGTVTEDDSIKFGKRELRPHPIAKYVKVSNTALRSTVMDVGQIVQNRLAYKFGRTMENAYLNGSGANQPLGVFTASADGISTARDVSTGNTQTSLTFDGLIEAKFTLRSEYWGAARWLFHRDAVKMLTKLKDGEGQYVWRESVRAGEPNMLLGLPVVISELVPNTFTSGLYVGLLGDFSYYWIADALDMQLQRLVELYAHTNQTAFQGRMESDGMPVLAEAFVRVKLA